MKITVITIFPEFFASFTSTSIIKRAIESGRVEFETVDFRTFTWTVTAMWMIRLMAGDRGWCFRPSPSLMRCARSDSRIPMWS